MCTLHLIACIPAQQCSLDDFCWYQHYTQNLGLDTVAVHASFADTSLSKIKELHIHISTGYEPKTAPLILIIIIFILLGVSLSSLWVMNIVLAIAVYAVSELNAIIITRSTSRQAPSSPPIFSPSLSPENRWKLSVLSCGGDICRFFSSRQSLGWLPRL